MLNDALVWAVSTMSQTECNPLKVAHEYVTELGLTDLSYRHPVVSETETVWTVRYELPPDCSGLSPLSV